ncbi:MAG TPA: ATP-dependent Clp protease ATP-binding subunit [Patescibacteria group bacterium]
MSNRLRLLAQTDLFLHQVGFIRWIVRATLFILLLASVLLGDSNAQALILGFFFIILPLGILSDLFSLFLKEEINIAESLQQKDPEGITYETATLLARSHGRENYLWLYLLQHPSTRFILNRLGVDRKKFYALSHPEFSFKEWNVAAHQLAHSEGVAVSPRHFFEVTQKADIFVSLWKEYGITERERLEVWQWYERISSDIKQRSQTTANKIRFAGAIGRDWASGYTRYLEQYAIDLTSQLQAVGAHISLVGHVDEKKRILEYLARDHTHNVLVVGEEGIGKERLIYSLTNDFNSGTVPLSLRYKHIYRLETGQVVSARSQNELEMRLHAIFQEASTVGNIVLVIPDFHLLVGAQHTEGMGAINASALLTSYLESPSLQVIGTMPPQAYYSYVKPNAALEPHLLPVEVKEITASEALRVVQDEIFRYESTSKHIFTYQALAKLIQIAEQHIHDTPYPEKALSLLDEVAGAASQEPQQLIYARDVERIVGEKLKVPIGAASTSEREVLSNLENLIRARIIGQNEAVNVVANSLRRARAGLHSGKRPIGSFLFLGPTGVGKTEMAKTIAALYYKNEKAFIRMDMSEYQTPESLEKLVGTATSPGLLTTAVTDQPFSVVLLDEIEKAAPSVRNLFLQILDDGRVTDGYGKQVDFTNSMVIATSNAGAQFIREAVESNTLDTTFKQRLLEYLQVNGIYAPEWLNRFDAVVVFLPLSKEEIREVAKLQVAALTEQLQSHNIALTVQDDVYDFLVERGYDPQFGARPMRRAVQDTIESALAKVLLNDSTEGLKQITLTRDMLV